MSKLTGPVVDELDDDLFALWEERSDGDFGAYVWEDIITSIQDTARKAAALDGVTPARVIDGQIKAVRHGWVDGGHTNRPYGTAPFCGCLIGWAGHIAGQPVSQWPTRDPLFLAVRRLAKGFAPVEILAFLLKPGEQDTLQADLVIQALEQAREGL